MTISSAYARFACRTCGETVYSPVLTEQQEGSSSRGETLELSCSSGHTDQYKRNEVILVPTKPDLGLRVKHALAAGG